MSSNSNKRINENDSQLKSLPPPPPTTTTKANDDKITKDAAINNANSDAADSNKEQKPPQIPYRRDRTPSIVVQTLGLSLHNKEAEIIESIELLPGDDSDLSQHSNNSSDQATDPKSSTSGIDEPNQSPATGPGIEKSNESLGGSGGGGAISPKGSSTSLHNSSSPVAGTGLPSPLRGTRTAYPLERSPLPPGTSRRLSLNIGTTAPRRQSLTVEGLSSLSITKELSSSGNATGSLRNKAALKPGHSLMGWMKLAATAKNLSGTNGKIIEVTPDELAKHDTEEDCWVALKGNVYNVTTYLQYHPGGVEELMRGAGRDATELFNEIHCWVNYESILAKCLIGPYKVESPLKEMTITSTSD